MRIGIANPFAYRPHVAQLVFLARQLERLGHQLFFLACGGGLDNCNSRVTKTGLAHRLECLKCRAGGFRSYLDVRPGRLDLPVKLTADDLELGRVIAHSSAVSALQLEHAAQVEGADFQALLGSLSESAAVAYLNTRRWIVEHQLDCVFFFNGRFDLTRAVFEGCRAQGIRSVSVERSWFGSGLQLLPDENCLGLRNIHRLCERWSTRPLTQAQAARASALMTRRLRRTSVGEWRQYNVQSTSAYKEEAIKYLFLPSSQHEWLGHPDRLSEWPHPVDGVESLLRRLGVPMTDLVVRGHPGWAMKIKNYGPNRANEFYTRWTQRVGATYIEPSSSLETHSLIKAAQVILVNGSSASMEASWRGKPVISFVPAAFTTSGISQNFFGPGDVDRLDEGRAEALRHPERGVVDPMQQCRLSLRQMYCVTYRVMQFVDYVRSPNPYIFDFAEPPDLSGLESLVHGTLVEDDDEFAADERGESAVVEAILADQQDVAQGSAPSEAQMDGAPLLRRSGYKLIDRFSL